MSVQKLCLLICALLLHSLGMNVARAIIERLGGTRPLARTLNIPPSTVQFWKRKGKFPVARMVELEAATKLPREALYPDLFERPAPAREVV